jgi:hypothetical protein
MLSVTAVSGIRNAAAVQEQSPGFRRTQRIRKAIIMTGTEEQAARETSGTSKTGRVRSNSGFWAAVRRWQDKPWMAETLSSDPVMRLPWLGFRIFKWLIILSIIIVAILVTYAYKTYPSADAILRTNQFPPETTFPQKLEILAAERATWVSNIKDLGQLFLVAPIFSLVGTVVGYIFGVSRQDPQPGVRHQGGGSGPADDETPPTTPHDS